MSYRGAPCDECACVFLFHELRWVHMLAKSRWESKWCQGRLDIASVRTQTVLLGSLNCFFHQGRLLET